MALQLASSLILILCVVAFVQGQPQYQVQVELPVGLLSYRNGFVNQLADGSCCCINETSPECFKACTEVHINLCFRDTSNDTNDTSCTLGEKKFALPTAVNGIIVFNATEGATTTTYPGSFQVHYVTSALNPMKIIDSGMTTFSIPVGDEIKIVAVSGSISLFRIKDILVSCKEGYFGPDCGTPCTPRDDSTGHFTCDVNGAIVCLPGYQNTTTNCVEEISKPLTTQSSTEMTPSTESTTTGQGDREAVVVPMAVGGAVGGSALLLLIVGFVVVIVLVWRSKRQRNVQPEGDALVFKALPSHHAQLESSSESGQVTNDTATSAGYTRVNRDNYTQQEEAPPIIPYKGDPYTEVARTGLFSTETATPEQRGLPEVVMANSPAYAEIRQPRVFYTDVALSKVRAKSDAHPLAADTDNTRVQYSSVHAY